MLQYTIKHNKVYRLKRLPRINFFIDIDIHIIYIFKDLFFIVRTNFTIYQQIN